jgi:hypothetical protein
MCVNLSGESFLAFCAPHGFDAAAICLFSAKIFTAVCVRAQLSCDTRPAVVHNFRYYVMHARDLKCTRHLDGLFKGTSARERAF